MCDGLEYCVHYSSIKDDGSHALANGEGKESCDQQQTTGPKRSYFVRKQSLGDLKKFESLMVDIRVGREGAPIPPQSLCLKDLWALVVFGVWSLMIYGMWGVALNDNRHFGFNLPQVASWFVAEKQSPETNIPQVLTTTQQRILLFGLVYETYLLWDHIPVFLTNTVYESPKFNYRNLRLTAFWGCEAMAGIYGYLALGAPIIVLGNIFNHLYFILCEYYWGIIVSRWFNYGQKPMWLNVAVFGDCVLHFVCSAYALNFLLADERQFCNPTLWTILSVWLVVITLHTIWFHWSYVRLGHFLVYLPYFKNDPACYRRTRLYMWIADRCGWDDKDMAQL